MATSHEKYRKAVFRDLVKELKHQNVDMQFHFEPDRRSLSTNPFTSALSSSAASATTAATSAKGSSSPQNLANYTRTRSTKASSSLVVATPSATLSTVASSSTRSTSKKSSSIDDTTSCQVGSLRRTT